MKCPSCSSDLRMTDRHGVEIDYCPQCRGVWLDRGELDKIIERSSGDRDDDDHDEYRRQAPPPPPPGHEHGYGHRKKKSFWREMFDFD